MTLYLHLCCSEEFPDENEYDSYLTSHGGSANALTDTASPAAFANAPVPSLCAALCTPCIAICTLRFDLCPCLCTNACAEHVCNSKELVPKIFMTHSCFIEWDGSLMCDASADVTLPSPTKALCRD